MRVTAHTQPVASRTESVCCWTVFLGTDVQRQHMYADVKLRQSFTLDGLYTSIWYGMSPIRVKFIDFLVWFVGGTLSRCFQMQFKGELYDLSSTSQPTLALSDVLLRRTLTPDSLYDSRWARSEDTAFLSRQNEILEWCCRSIAHLATKHVICVLGSLLRLRSWHARF